MKHILLTVPLILLFSLFAFGQNGFAKNQKVEVEWKGRWYKASILEVKENGYKIHYDGYSDSYDETVPATRIRTVAGTNGVPSKTAATALAYGKYGCTASKYENGSYVYLPKGSFTLSKNGQYSYHGFAKPSSGTFTVDASGTVSFKGGYFNGGTATPMQGEKNRFYLVFPTIPDGRWTCRLLD